METHARLRRSRRIVQTIFAVGACIAVSACMSSENLHSYLDTIPVAEADFSAMADGTYPGEYKIDLPPGAWAANQQFEVDLTVSGARATEILIREPEAFTENEDFAAYIDRIIDAQSLHVDAVSGGTISSKAFIKAVEDAATLP